MKAKNTIKNKTATTLGLKTKATVALVSLASGAAIFFAVFFLMQTAGVISPSEEIVASPPVTPTSTEQQLAMDFNGKTNFISVGNPSLGISNKFSVTAWVRWDTIPSGGNGWANICTYATKTGYGSGDNGLWWLQHNSDNSKFEFALQTSNSRNVVFSNTTPKKGVWYHLAGTYDGTYERIYVNGVLENSTANTGSMTSSTSSHELTIGEWPNTNSGTFSRRFNGQIDEVSIWKKTLSITEIKDLMCKSIDPTATNLKAYWNFNDNSNLTKTTDLTSNHYAGNITGAKYVSSGAPVGSANSYYYTSPAAKFSIKNPVGDSIVFSNFSSQPTGIQLYYQNAVNNSANITNNPADMLFTDRTYGAYLVSSTPITYTVTYYYKDNPNVMTPGAKAAGAYSPTDLVLVSRSASDTTWTELTSAVNDITNMKFTYSGLTGRTEIALGFGGSHLPISLISFVGKPNDKDIVLNWKTATEINNDYFTIERSIDCKTFDIVTKINGAGNSNMILKYDYTDRNVYEAVKSEKVYYRLKQTDFDGKFTYSGIIGIAMSNESSAPFEIVSTSPNPFINDLYLNISTTIEGQAVLKFYSATGTIVKCRRIDLQSGINTIALNDNNDLKKGIYLLSLEMSDLKSKTIKVIKY